MAKEEKKAEQPEVEVSESASVSSSVSASAAAPAPAASAAPAAVEPKKSVAEEVKETAGGMPGGGVNTWSATGEAGTSDQEQHTQSAGKSSSVQSSVWNDETYARVKELMPELAEMLRGAKSIDDLLTPEQKAAMDPEAVARKKKGVDFRRSMHELVELARIGSDIGASFAGGNAYKRKDPNYRQYEEEKAAVDKARNDALRSRLALAQEDRQRAKDLLSAFLPRLWDTMQEGQTSQTSDGTTHGETRKEGASLGHQKGGNTIINNGGAVGSKDAVSVQRPYAVQQKRVDAEGDETLKGNSYGYATVQFADKKRKNEFMRGMSQALLGDGDERTSKSGKDFRKFYDYFAANSGVDDVEFYDNKGNMTADGVKVVRHILSRNNAGGEMENVGYTYNNKDYTNVVESGLLYCTDNANATKLRDEYVKNGWITEWQDEGTGELD